MSGRPRKKLTPEEYLAVERQAETKSEYFDGELIAMTGASRKHNLIVANLTRELTQQFKGKPCELYPSDMRVRVRSAKLYTYPDIVVVCGEPEFEDESVDTLLNPTVIIEVLSESTESYDRGKKFAYYRTLPSLVDYVLVTQDEYKIEQYNRQPDGRWLLSEESSLAGAIEIASLQCVLALREVYDRILFT